VNPRIPGFAQLPWGCSFADIDWKKEGHGSSKLEYLAMEKGWFYEAHRAEVDCTHCWRCWAKSCPLPVAPGWQKLIAASPPAQLRTAGDQRTL